MFNKIGFFAIKLLPFINFCQYIDVRYLKINKEFRSKVKKEIQAYKNKQELNLEKIMEEYSSYVAKIIENMANPYLAKEDKEEILSDTFFILWKNKEKLEDNKLLSSYLAGITRNLVKEKARVIPIHDPIEDYENKIFDKKNIDMLCEQREKTKMIKQTIEEMKEEEVEIFKSYYYGGKKIKEIAKFLNISEFNVKTKLYRIRRKIKQELEKGGYGNGTKS